MELKLNKVNYSEVDYSDLDSYIAYVYGLDKFECTLEAPNDSTHQYSVKKESLDKYSQERLDKIIKDQNCEFWALDVVLQDMCNKGKLEEGAYLLNVCW